jgi:ferredoxin
MKIRIDKAACVGNARCAAVAGDLPPGMEELAERGARACPERIIIIEK